MSNPSPRPATVAVCQVAPRLGDPGHNRRLIAREIGAAAAEGADIVVLPELVTSGYAFSEAAEARVAAEPADGPTVAAVRQLAAQHQVSVVLGLPELEPPDTVYNSAVVVDAAGLRAVYRKVHLWGREREFFAAGRLAPPVVSTPWGSLGVAVCYDLEFPEWLRMLALAGADLVCAPTNWPHERRPHQERPVERLHVQVGAGVNRMFIAACDRIGPERGVRWLGGSIIAGPDGYPLAMSDLQDRPQRLLARCELAQARDKSIGELNDRIRDRVPSLYALGDDASSAETPGNADG